MFFRQVIHEEKSCLSYIIGCTTLGTGIVVDPQGDPQSYLETLDLHGLKLQSVIETHGQADHISIARELAALRNVPVCFGPRAEVRFTHRTLQDGEVLTVGYRKIKILHTPGHTPEHISLHIDDWFVLTGDTLFVGDVGRVDLSLQAAAETAIEDKSRLLYQSLQKLSELPDWTEIYPGHFSGSVCGKGMDGKTISTVGREKLKNKALQLSQEEFVTYITQNLPPRPEDFARIKQSNIGLNSTTENSL